MSRWNSLINSHFAGQQLIAEGFDQCRGRPARAFVVPGDPENFGITDGTDAWIIPARAGAGGNIFKGVDIADWLRKFFAGDKPTAVVVARRRHLFVAEEPAPAERPARRRLESQEQPTTEAPRRRHVSL